MPQDTDIPSITPKFKDIELDPHNPRAGYMADAPGSFELVVESDQSVVDPGGSLKIRVFVTGYGEISAAKLLQRASADVYDTSKSKAFHSIGSIGGQIQFGVAEQTLTSHGGMIALLGVGPLDADPADTTYFFDTLEVGQTRLISTEGATYGPAPFEFEIILKDSISPGNYYFSFVLTYFNGNEWKSSVRKLTFSVRNIVQRHEGFTALIAFLAAAGAIFSAFLSLARWLTTV